MPGLSAVLLAAASIAAAPVATTVAGHVAGTAEAGVAVWRGIPYAKPPIGSLRWHAPQTPTSWQGERAATRFGAICMQPPAKSDTGVGVESPAEDCLTLNVWAPAGAEHLPVMVWIHGGGYVNGSGSAALYDGARLARRGVVVVTINYRLGRFGFMAHPGLAGDSPNFGLLDQVAALRWVRDNILAFGGDPARVTVFGNSAGGESILFLMAMPAAKGLFERAIVESGLGGRKLPMVAGAVEATRATVPLATLRAESAAEVLAWGTPSIYRGFGPMIDGRTVFATPTEAFAAGAQRHVPLIIGFNGLEVPAAASGGTAGIAALTGHGAADRARWVAAYGDERAYNDYAVSDVLFRGPAYRLAQAHATVAPTYLYTFDILPPTLTNRLKGAPHASERAYVFGTLGAAPWPTDITDASAADEIASRWTAFARGEAPNASGQVPWASVDPRGSPRALRFARGSTGVADPLPAPLAEVFGVAVQ